MAGATRSMTNVVKLPALPGNISWEDWDVAGGEWSVEIEGPAVIIDMEGREEILCHRQRWSFSGAGTFMLQIRPITRPEPIVSLMGDDATPMRIIREAIQGSLQTVIENRNPEHDASNE